VTDDALSEFSPDWDPDGNAITFGIAAGFSHVHVYPLDGSAPTTLTSGDWDAFGPAASADGKWVAYAGTKNGDPDIWAVPAAGGESRLVSAAPGDDVSPQWSPDGTQLVFSSRRAGNQDIWIVGADGSQPRALTTWTSSETAPRWSPDGTTILFLSGHESSGADLWTIPVAGGAPLRLTVGGLAAITGDWSPDGTQIVFVGQTAASAGRAVFVVAAAGGTPRLVAPTESFGGIWSRDGRELAVQRVRGGYAKVEIYSVAGALLRTLTAADTVYQSPGAWTPDGSQLVLWTQDLYGDGGGKLAVQPAAGGEQRLLAVPSGMSVNNGRDFVDGGRGVVGVAGSAYAVLVRVKVR
jgi:Tol biopolymer transport system component